MLLGQSSKDWNVVYKDEQGNSFKSEAMDKLTALNYLDIFDDAYSIESKTGQIVFKKDALNAINTYSKGSNNKLLIATIIILIFVAILFYISV